MSKLPRLFARSAKLLRDDADALDYLSDDWTEVSYDSSKGAHFEHTYTIAPDGKVFVLTAEDGGKEQLARLGVEVSDLL